MQFAVEVQLKAEQALILAQLYNSLTSVRLHEVTQPAGFGRRGLEFCTHAAFG